MKPSLRWGSTPAPTSSTRACRMKSPFSFFQTKWNSSRCAHMFTPAAREGVLLGRGVVGGGARDLRRTHVPVSVEDAQRPVLAQGRGTGQ